MNDDISEIFLPIKKKYIQFFSTQQKKRGLLCIVQNEYHTPPAPAAIAGAIRTFAFLRTSTASGVQGIFEPRKQKIM